MKRLVALLILTLAARLPLARAQQAPDDQYVVIYALVQQADSLDSSGQLQQALAQYARCRANWENSRRFIRIGTCGLSTSA
jgi:hypothetical protein